MLVLRRCLLAFLLLFAVPLSAQPGDSGWFYRGSDIAPDPAWRFGTLPNGMRFAVRRNPLPAGQVSIRIRIDAGSLNETDDEQGWAHFVEHMVFRGTEKFGDREARHVWQELGASFGSDTNANTGADQTVYQLDLPRSDRASLDRSLAILAEMVDKARFDPATVDAERKVVLAEKERRPEIATKYDKASRPLFYAGLKIAERDTIGTNATLAGASPQRLRAFYERWYRPEAATIVMVGDVDPAMMVELIAHNFAGWTGTGPAPQQPDYGRIADPKQRVASLAYPGAPYATQVVWLRPHIDSPDTLARERDELADRLATQILNRRLEAKARGEAAFIGASVGIGRTRHIADTTQLSITAKDAQWSDSLDDAFAIIADALKVPPSTAEIARELSDLRSSFTAAVAGESTLRSQQRAQQMVFAVDSGDVVTTSRVMLTLLDKLAKDMTPARIEQATKGLFDGTRPRLLLLAAQPVAGGDEVVAAALAAAEKAAPAIRQADRTVTFDDLPQLGRPSREVSRQRIDDMDVTIVRFANGSTLTFKPTKFEKGSVLVELRFGNGLAGLPPSVPTVAWTSSVVGPSGLGNLDLDALDRLTNGRRMTLNFGVDEDALVLSGATSAEDLPDQLRLLTSKLAFPRWDAALFSRYKASWLENYELNFASASARGRRELDGVLHPGDDRWLPVDKPGISASTSAEVEKFFAPLLAVGPVDAIIVGDVSLNRAVAAAGRTIGALPVRASPPPANTSGSPPKPNPLPRVFTHNGAPDQAFAVIGWSTLGGTANIDARRALAVAASILQVRLFDRMREEEGATYAPSATAATSEEFPAWGVFFAAAEIRPENAEKFFRIARELVADLATKPVAPDEFARAQNPIVSGIERRIKTNGYWLDTVENWTTRPERIEQTRRYLSDYRGMTAEKVRAAVAAYVADEGDWSMLVVPDKSRADGN